jgi:acyl CoA:acetate/3-ketoacid CoA transferase alpha subunit
VIHQGGAPIKYKPDGSGDIEIPSPPREHRQFNGNDYIMEEAITADYSLIRVHPTDVCFACHALLVDPTPLRHGRLTKLAT